MSIKEISRDAKNSLKGKWKDLLKPTLFYYLIPLVINLAFNFFMAVNFVELFTGILQGNYELVNGIGIVSLIISIIVFIIISIVNVLLSYGMAACITSLKRGETLTFGTLFKKIREHGLKALLVSFVVTLKIIGWFILLMVAYIVVAGFLMTLNIILMIVGTILLLVVFIVVLAKVLELSFMLAFVNFIIFDYADKSTKEIIRKAKVIIKKKGGTYATLLLLTLLILLPLIALEIIMSNIDLIIWEPYITWYWGIPISVESAAPSWWSLITNLITSFVTIFTFLKVLSITSAFYESLSPANLFDEDYELEVEKFRYVIFTIGLIILYVVAIILISMVWSEVYSKLAEWRYPEEETPTVNASVENINLESIGITEDGQIVVKVTNKDENTAYINTVKATFKDEYGNELEELTASPSSFYIESNEDMYVYIYSYSIDFETDEEYQNYDLSAELEDLDGLFFSAPKIVNAEIKTKEMEDYLLVEVDERLENVKAIATFYKEDKVVGIAGNGFESSIKGEKSTFIKVDYPSAGYWADDLEFDKYEVRIYDAEQATRDPKSVTNLVAKILGITEDNKIVVEFENKNDEAIYLTRVNMILKDKNGEFIDAIVMDDVVFQILAKDTVYSTFSVDTEIEDIKKIDEEFIYELTTSSYSISGFFEEELEMKCNDKEDVLEVEVKNTIADDIDTIKVNVVFYKDKEVVGFSRGSRIWETVAPGEVVSIEIEHPDDIEYDSFEADIIKAEKE